MPEPRPPLRNHHPLFKPRSGKAPSLSQSVLRLQNAACMTKRTLTLYGRPFQTTLSPSLTYILLSQLTKRPSDPTNTDPPPPPFLPPLPPPSPPCLLHPFPHPTPVPQLRARRLVFIRRHPSKMALPIGSALRLVLGLCAVSLVPSCHKPAASVIVPDFIEEK